LYNFFTSMILDNHRLLLANVHRRKKKLLAIVRDFTARVILNSTSATDFLNSILRTQAVFMENLKALELRSVWQPAKFRQFDDHVTRVNDGRRSRIVIAYLLGIRILPRPCD